MNRLIRIYLAAGVLVCAPWCVLHVSGADLTFPIPLSLNQNAVLFNPVYITNNFYNLNLQTNPPYTTNILPGVNWQSYRGVPIGTNYSPATGSDGRAPTLAEQIAYGTNFASAWPATTNQFAAFVGFSAVPVGTYTNCNTNL